MIIAFSVTRSVYDQLRDQCMISHVIIAITNVHSLLVLLRLLQAGHHHHLQQLPQRSLAFLGGPSLNPLYGLPWWLSGKESACNAGNLGLNPGSGRTPREVNGNPLLAEFVLSWKIPWTEEQSGLQSMGSQESDTT